MKLHHRIVVPLALVALAATALSAYVALSAAARALEVRVEAQVTNASALISQSDFALNPAILQSVKAISGVEVITFTPGGLVLASTVPSGQAGPLVGAVTAAGIAAGALADTGHGVARVVRLSCGTPCYVAFRRPPALPDTIVAVVSEASELTAATRAVTRAIVFAAGVSLLLMVLVSQLIARRVTAPIDELVHFASGVAVGDSDRRAAVGTDEVGRLGQAFNDMLDRLERSRQALVRSEKLALAGLIAARVAHDIRNPLSSIKMQTQLLRSALHPGARAAGRRDVDLKSGEMLDGVLRDISQVETVISDLLELARPGVLKKHPVRLDALVREVLLQLAPQLAHRKIRVELHLDDQLPPVGMLAGGMAACGSLAGFYFQGNSVTMDKARAAGLLERACNGGHAPSCSNVGLMFSRGDGLPKDDARALEYLKKACDFGLVSACRSLAEQGGPPRK